MDSLNRHERRLLQRMEKQEQRQEEESQTRKKARRGKAIWVAGIVLILAGAGYGIFALASTPTGNLVGQGSYDLAGIPGTFVHWHADVDVLVCGEEQTLREALPGSQIGTASLHTHDPAENRRSLPTSDGNGVIHNEGVIPRQPSEQTLGRFMDHLGMAFSESQLLDKRNGDLCPDGQPGQVRMTVDGQPSLQWRNYIPRDGDAIRLEFG
ncbi:MAG: hypothetical protein HY520_02265 [Candidatus Aenigmarchaeota archaeon]|nr:hypothetical protein [Candidatus Aenigmarchaeota archaeon]